MKKRLERLMILLFASIILQACTAESESNTRARTDETVSQSSSAVSSSSSSTEPVSESSQVPPSMPASVPSSSAAVPELAAEPPQPAIVGTEESEAQPAADSSVHYPNCTAVKAAGAAPLYAGQPGYARHLDRDGDGVACE